MAGLDLAITSRNIAVLFKEKHRTRISPMFQGERLFDFYDASGRESLAIYREFMNLWVAHYPDSERAELIHRFVKGSNSQYYAALVEVIVHEILRNESGHIEHHPEVPHSPARPDFVKTRTNGEVELYVEVTTCAQAEKDVTIGNRTAKIYDAIDKISLPPDCALGISIEKHGAASPNLNILKKEILH